MVQRVLVAGLRGRQDVQVLDPLVLDQRLMQADAVVDDVDEVEHDPALAAHDQVEVAQADVEVDDDGLLAAAAPGRWRWRRREVVLPTPPLPDVTTMTLSQIHPPRSRSNCARARGLRTACGSPAARPRARRGHVAAECFGSIPSLTRCTPGDRQQLGLELVAEDQRGLVALDAGEGPAAQRAVDVDVARWPRARPRR